MIGHIVVLGVVAYLLSKVLMSSSTSVPTSSHRHPLIAVARDNGFPCDHVLLGAYLAASLGWIDRRVLPASAVGMLLVLLGRLGVGAHHTIDVLGSVGSVAVAALVTLALPLPATCHRPLLPTRVRNTDVETAQALAACTLLNAWWQLLVIRRALGKER
jgi:membrane-associated phospholipid phosphatase